MGVNGRVKDAVSAVDWSVSTIRKTSGIISEAAANNFIYGDTMQK